MVAMNSGTAVQNCKLGTDLFCRAVYFSALAQSIPGGRIYTRQVTYWLAYLVVTILACAGCATVSYQERPFFLQEQGLETHGRKTWFDRLVEFDPGKTQFQVAADYAQDPPRRIAILPFVDRGSANFVVNKIPLSFRDKKEQEEWAWTYANRLRRDLTGYLAQQEVTVVNLLNIDT